MQRLEKKVPTREDLKNYLERLIWFQSDISESEFVNNLYMARFDPRVAELTVQFLEKNFKRLNAYTIKQNLQSVREPSIIGVIIDFAKQTSSEKAELKLWSLSITENIKEGTFKKFFIGLDTINPKQDMKIIKKNLKAFERWGYYWSEPLISNKLLKKNNANSHSFMSKPLRIELLFDLLLEKKSITVNEYIEALNFMVHRRQAERDLKNAPFLKAKGFTQNRVYILK